MATGRVPNPTCLARPRPITPSGVALQRAFPRLTFNQPLMLLQPPGDPSRIFVMERGGALRAFPASADPAPGTVTTVLSLTVNAAGEGGFLGVAFPPDWTTGNNKVVYVSYTVSGAGTGYTDPGTGATWSRPLRTVVSRVRSVDGGQTFGGAEEVLFTIDQPFDNHNGGHLAFGPDGYLYFGLGDGGSGNDPLNAGQRLDTNLGKFIRIDVNVPFAQRYAIPPDNPFAADPPCNLGSARMTAADAGTRCAEIYAWGLRNPWRWSFDQGSTDLWVGDVGQGTREEVDLVQRGGNYGWRIREGVGCRGGGTGCASAGLIPPVVDYGRSEGSSITGGFVYRGSRIPGLIGRFVFGDFGSQRIWAVREDPVDGGVESEVLIDDSNIGLASFGQTLDGEVYALNLYSGQVLQLVPAQDAGVAVFPQLLSQTGCFEPTDPSRPVAAMVPYQLNAPLWSDGTRKDRFFAIPDGTTITVGTDGDFDLPVGSVTAKTFWIGARRVETRLMMRHADGSWGGYSYQWNDAGTEATLLPAGFSRVWDGQTWQYPSRAQCLACHTQVAGRTLGLEAAQLNLTVPGRTVTQLEDLENRGYFSAPLGAAATLKLEPYDGPAPIAARARAYLHSNCSVCHRSGAGQGPQDFRASIPFAAMNLCNVSPSNGDLGIADARLLVPGDPGRSLVAHRMAITSAGRMPPLATSLVDDAGVQLITGWIQSLSSCP